MRDGYEYIESTYSLKALTEFIGEHPEYMSVVSFNVNDPDSGIFYQADVPRTLGTLTNIFLLIEYERQVEEGLIDPTEIIAKEKMDWFALPGVNEEAHNAAMKILTKESDSFTLDAAISVMVEYNDLAIHDYFWFRLGEENLRSLIPALGLTQTEVPVPFSGIYPSLNPDLVDLALSHSTEYQFDALSSQPRKGMVSLFIDVATDFATNESYNASFKKVFKENRLNMSFMEERDALKFFPHSTAREMAGLMARIYKQEVISPEVSRRVKEKLGWVFEGEAITRSFSEYGALYDNRMGMLSGIDFGTSIHDGHSSAQAVFFDKLPVAFWVHLSSNHMQEDYQQRLIWDPALFETTKEEISN